MIIKIAIPPTKPGIIRTEQKMKERNKTQKRWVMHNAESQIQGIPPIFFVVGPLWWSRSVLSSLLKPHWLRCAQKDLLGFKWFNITRLLIFPSVNGRRMVGQKALDTFSCRWGICDNRDLLWDVPVDRWCPYKPWPPLRNFLINGIHSAAALTCQAEANLVK